MRCSAAAFARSSTPPDGIAPRRRLTVAEDYVRPPLLGREAPSARAAAVRFWVVFGLILCGVIVGVFFLYRLATGGGGEGDPGLNPQGARVVQQVR